MRKSVAAVGVLVTVLSVRSVLFGAPVGVFVNGTELDAETPSGSSGAGWTYDGAVLMIDDGSGLTLSGTNESGRVRVRLRGTSEIALDGLMLKTAEARVGGLVELESSAKATIDLTGVNVLAASAAAGTAAICCPYGASLMLTASRGPRAVEAAVGSVSNKLVVNDTLDCSLTASGGSGAAAIGGARAACGNIRIEAVTMNLSSGGPYLIGRGELAADDDPYRVGEIVFADFPYLTGDAARNVGELVSPRPHNVFGRPLFLLRQRGVLYLPTGLWTVDERLWRVSFNSVMTADGKAR